MRKVAVGFCFFKAGGCAAVAMMFAAACVPWAATAIAAVFTGVYTGLGSYLLYRGWGR